MPDVTSDEDIAHKVYVHYAREFKSLMSMQFMLRTFDDEDIAEYIPQQRDKLLEYKKYDGDFNHLLSVFSPTFVHFFECFLVYDMSSDGVRRLNHYLMFFEVPEDIKRNFLDMCHRLFEFLESFV